MSQGSQQDHTPDQKLLDEVRQHAVELRAAIDHQTRALERLLSQLATIQGAEGESNQPDAPVVPDADSGTQPEAPLPQPPEPPAVVSLGDVDVPAAAVRVEPPRFVTVDEQELLITEPLPEPPEAAAGDAGMTLPPLPVVRDGTAELPLPPDVNDFDAEEDAAAQRFDKAEMDVVDDGADETSAQKDYLNQNARLMETMARMWYLASMQLGMILARMEDQEEQLERQYY